MTPNPEPELDQPELEADLIPRLAPTSIQQQNMQKSTSKAKEGSSPIQEFCGEQGELSKPWAIGDISCAFDKAMEWIETAKDQYDHMEQIVLNIYEALGGIDMKDIDEALQKISKPQNLVDRDVIGLKGVCFGKSRGIWLLLIMT